MGGAAIIRFAYTGGVRLAILSDLHANLEALEACLAHARGAGAQRYAFLGDLVGYGADPDAVIEIVAEHASRGAIVVKGNHDVAAIEGDTDYLNRSARDAILWTRTRLSPKHVQFIDDLPLVVREEAACFVHASAAQPEEWEYVDSPAAAERSVRASDRSYTFAGHVHEQRLFVANTLGRMRPYIPGIGVEVPIPPRRACLAVVGSAGQPRDGNPAACYVTADLDFRVMRFHRIPYDHHEAARKIRAAGLPESLALRLERGV